MSQKGNREEKISLNPLASVEDPLCDDKHLCFQHFVSTVAVIEIHWQVGVTENGYREEGLG